MLQVHHFSKKLAGSTQIVDSVALSVQASRDQQNNSVKHLYLYLNVVCCVGRVEIEIEI